MLFSLFFFLSSMLTHSGRRFITVELIAKPLDLKISLLVLH